MSNRKFDIFKRLEEIPSAVYIILAVACLIMHTVVCAYLKISVILSGVIFTSVYLIFALIIRLAVSKKMAFFIRASKHSDEQNNSVISTFRDTLKIPYAVVTDKGKIVTANMAMRSMAGKKSTMFNSDISEICGLTIESILKSVVHFDPESNDEFDEEIDVLHDKAATCQMGTRCFHIECHPLHSEDKLFYMLIFNDITELKTLSMTHRALHTVIAYIAIDNLDEIAQYAKVSYQAEATEADAMLREWVKDMGGILREYDSYKYMLILTRHALLSCVKNKFEILDKIREVRLGDGSIPITVSMGITTVGATLAEREHEALVCFEMALQRGGDQAVLKNEQGTFYFGGRTKSQQKRSGGHSRVIANKLCSMISASPNVLVMGHSNPDFDSIGACVGIAALCNHLGVNVNIVTNLESPSFHACTSRLCEFADYKNIFVDAATGLEKSQFGTLLIIVDTNNFAILEAPEIANGSFNTVVIDHHIKKNEFEYEPQLAYIEHSASSTCELISEILEFSIPLEALRKEEANVIMSGIMVDTQNFTRTVGTRTFAAALYLRGAGASTEYVRTFFEQDFTDYYSEAVFSTNAVIYSNEIAITASDGTGSPGDRVAAAKAADGLLSVKNVNAAFALVRVGDTVHISGRSNGKINVQLILEKIGGGGHFDVAGAALSASGIEGAKQKLTAAIDEYYNDISSQG